MEKSDGSSPSQGCLAGSLYIYMGFVDLENAYNGVPLEALWGAVGH